MLGPQSNAVSPEVQADKDHTIIVAFALSLAENFHRLNNVTGSSIYIGGRLSPNNATAS